MLDTCSARRIAAHSEFFDISNPSWKEMVAFNQRNQRSRVNAIFISWHRSGVTVCARICCANCAHEWRAEGRRAGAHKRKQRNAQEDAMRYATHAIAPNPNWSGSRSAGATAVTGHETLPCPDRSGMHLPFTRPIGSNAPVEFRAVAVID